MMRSIHPLFCFRIPAIFFLLSISSCGNPVKQATKELKEKGYEVSVRDYFLAAGSGDIEGFVLFKEVGFEIDEKDDSGNTALIKASAGGHLEMVEKILGMGADPRQMNQVGRDALMVASAKGFEEIARMLLGRGANPTIRDSEGWSALTIAAYNGHDKLVSLIGSQVPSDSLDEALLVAAFHGDSRVMVTLLGQGANINTRSPEGMTPLMISAKAGNLDAVQTLLQNHANPYSENGPGVTAAILAERAGHPEVQSFILNPDEWGSTRESMEILKERAKAQEALVADISVEETLRGPGEEALAGESGAAGRSAGGDPGDSHGGSAAGSEASLAQASPSVKESPTGSAHEEASSAMIELSSGGSSQGAPASIAPTSSGMLAAQSDEASSVGTEAMPQREAGQARNDSPTGRGESGQVRASDRAGVPVPDRTVAETVAAGSAERQQGTRSRPAFAVSVPAGGSATRGASATSLEASVAIPTAQQTRSAYAAATGSATGVLDRQRIREESKSKPVVSLNGSTLHSTSPEVVPIQSLVLSSFHEESLPIEVVHVDSNRARIRRLDQEGASPIDVATGQTIPGTSYEVQEVTRKFVSSKESKGRMVDVSRVRVQNKTSGTKHLLVKDIAGQSSDTYAILTAPNSDYRYVVKSGDVFRTSQEATGGKDFQVLDIRASAVIVKDLATDDVFIIARDGVSES